MGTNNVTRNESVISQHTTEELYKLGYITDNLLINFIYSNNRSFEERRKILLDIREGQSLRKFCADRNCPEYIYKKLIEEHEINSIIYKESNAIIKTLYEIEGYENRRRKLRELLNQFKDLKEATKFYKINFQTLIKYGIIWKIDIIKFNVTTGKKASIFIRIPKNEMQERKFMEEEIFKKLDHIFDTQYFYNDKSTNALIIEKEYETLKTKLRILCKERDEENISVNFTEDMFKRYYNSRFKDYLGTKKLPDGREVKVIKDHHSIIGVFRRFESEACYKVRDENNGDYSMNVINLFLKYQNKIPPEKVINTIRQLSDYKNERCNAVIRPNMDERKLKVLIQNYLKLYNFEDELKEKPSDNLISEKKITEDKTIINDELASTEEIAEYEKVETNKEKTIEEKKDIFTLDIKISNEDNIEDTFNDLRGFINMCKLSGKSYSINLKN